MRKTDSNHKSVLPHSPDVEVSVRNFGPIAEGKVDLRPLTVFVGPSNTGKTCFSTLVYALHGVFAELDMRSPEDAFRDALQAELKNCFDLPSVSALRRANAAEMTMSLKIRAGNGEEGWCLKLTAAASKWTLTPETSNAATADWNVGSRYYLPAIRSGLIQQHGLIASSLIGRATRGGRFSEVSTFSAGLAAFLQYLILYRPDREMKHGDMNAIADALEADVLGGQILARLSPTGYPDFRYRPQGMKEEMRLSHASAMVSELAPLVLLLRSGLGPGDMLIIEEPEAHLHPGAQSEMALTLARLIRAGVQVVITTHSDWLLKEIANLMRLGKLKQKGEKNIELPVYGEVITEPGDSQASWLLPEEVGVWWFQKDGVVKPIPFERSNGVEPADYEDVADELYARSVHLQDRLEAADRS